MSLAFLFVVDGPRLVHQAPLLAASLRAHHPDAVILAYVTKRTEVTGFLVRVFALCDVETRPLPSAEGVWRDDYVHGNKILALAAGSGADTTVFLDTDIILTDALGEEAMPDVGEIAVVPEGKATWGREGDRWDRAYAHFGMSPPADRVRLTRGRKRSYLPYFNAGFIVIREGDRVDGQHFGQHWKATAHTFDHNARIGGKRPWLDQITLPIAAYRFGYRPKVLADSYNYSVSGRLPRAGDVLVVLHYHRYRYLVACPQYAVFRTAVLAGICAPMADEFAAHLDRIEAKVGDDVATVADPPAHPLG